MGVNMKFYFAPLEGVTGYIYRNAHHTFFPETVDKYFAPFIVANQKGTWKTREISDLLPENNKGVKLIPQILTNKAEDFIETAKKIEQLGYSEINLNLGCPSGTVVSKNRGAGFLSQTDELNCFLDNITQHAVTKISVKTRIGKYDPDEFFDLLEIFNRYPLEELIVHPRIQTDFYKNKPNLLMFEEAVKTSKHPLCYNGDIVTVSDYLEIKAKFPSVESMMIGRGLLYNPALIREILGAIEMQGSGILKNGIPGSGMQIETLRSMHDQIYVGYQQILFGEKNVLFKMKEIWFYWIKLFENADKYAKKIKKAERLKDYEAVVASLFLECKIMHDKE